jgi:16S rRNA (uracil1498-N3)-methyltransferase
VTSVVSVTDAELHHLIVSRARAGRCVELINGTGKLARATIASIDKRQALLHIDTVEEHKRSCKEIILAQSIPRMNHLEWIVEKGTELGCSSFWLFPGILSEKDALSDNQHSRLKHLILAAVKQCGRLDIPEVAFKPPIEQWAPFPSGTLLYADPSEDAPFLWDLDIHAAAPIILLIGPESGFHAREREHMVNTLQAYRVRLHPNILRTETAALAGISLIQTILNSYN